MIKKTVVLAVALLIFAGSDLQPLCWFNRGRLNQRRSIITNDAPFCRIVMRPLPCLQTKLRIILDNALYISAAYAKTKTTVETTPPVTINISSLPPILTTEASFKELSGNNMLDAEEKAAIIVKIGNTGQGDSCTLKANVSASGDTSHIKYDNSKDMGSIPKGKTEEFSFQVAADENVKTGTVTFVINFTESCGFEPDPIKLTLNTKAFVPPQLKVVDVGIDDPTENGQIEPGEIVEVTARVQNVGYGEAENVKADVRIGENVFMGGDSPSSFSIGNLKSGAYSDVKFSMYINKRIGSGEKIPVSLKIAERRGKYGIEEALDLKANVPQKRTNEIVVKPAGEEEKGEIEIASGLSIDIETNIPKTDIKNPDGIAVVIGNRNYVNLDVPSVDYAIRDAQIVKEYLIKSLGFEAKNIIYEQNATFAKLREIFGTETDHKGKLHNYIIPDKSDVFIYYSGHGAPDLKDKTPYFVPVDCAPKYVSSNGYPLQTFYTNLSKLPAKSITVVIDACFSGGSDKGMLIAQASPVVVELAGVTANLVQASRNAAIFSCGSKDEICSWYSEKKHGLFTYLFLKGLKGAADKNKDKTITVEELHNYLIDKAEGVPYLARRLFNREQTPQCEGGIKDKPIIKY